MREETILAHQVAGVSHERIYQPLGKTKFKTSVRRLTNDIIVMFK